MWIQTRSKWFGIGHPQPLLTELRSFLGLANFYRRFVLGFSHITWPLSQVTKGGAREKIFWSEPQQKAFTELKNRLCSTPVLTLPDLQQPFEIETDASDYAIGAFLTQQGHPVVCQFGEVHFWHDPGSIYGIHY